MGCLIHLNWGSIKYYDLPADKLFVSEEGIRDFIKSTFRDVAENINEIISSFMKEIYASPVDERSQASTAFRVSKLCDCMGFDSKDLIQRESFWLLYDDEEVGDPDEA